MQITTSILTRFLELLASKGVLENKEVLIKAVEDGLEAFTVDSSNIFSIRGQLRGVISDIDNLAIGDIAQLRALLSNFDPKEKIDLKKNINKLVITSANNKLEVEYILKSPEYITNTIAKEKIETIYKKSCINEFVLNTSNIKKMLSYFGTLGNSNTDVYLSGKKDSKVLKFGLSKNENNLKASLDVECIKNDFNIKISSVFMAILSTVLGDVKIAINNDLPAVITYETEKEFKFIYLLAPKKK